MVDEGINEKEVDEEISRRWVDFHWLKRDICVAKFDATLIDFSNLDHSRAYRCP